MENDRPSPGRRRLIGASSLCFSLLAACGGEPEAARPNVLLIVIDTLRADHLSTYGYERETSPRLTELASEGLRYERAVAQAPWTTPSIGALMTSRYPSSLGIEGEQNALADELVLLPEALQAAGYQTAGVISHSFLGSEWNFDQGFELFDEANVQGHSAVTSEGVTNAATAVLRQLSADPEPFFLFVHYFDPHAAYVDHAGQDFGGPAGYDGPVTSGLLFRELRKMQKDTSDADLAELVRLYDSEIAFTDRQIGLLLDALRESGEWDDTMVIVTADHGEEFLDHGRFGHAKSLFEELIHVPLVVKPPASFKATVRAGTSVAEPVALIDVYPTVLQVTGATTEFELEGRSVFPQPPRGRTLFAETGRTGSAAAAISGSLKLIERAEGRQQLFDLASDPQEKTNLARTRGTDVDRLLGELREWREVSAARALIGETIQIDAQSAARLKELGYGGDD
ncbi:Choline-sulfatase [Planctomycetes bacterium Poly30]|uniref:Choline-sulfatase n=1 Tax=Saltatorellus ferox TaxID=2528018 RepID=A0A518EKD5_9BACT|nr:Choline-sulfatase [Planctomycetes bacterium Poly30]